MRALPILLLTALSGCLVPASSTWDAVSSEVLHGQLESLFASIDAADAPALLASMDESVILYDYDQDHRALVAHDKLGAAKVIDRLFAQRQVTGGTLKSYLSGATCHATTRVGFCAIEYEQVLTRGEDKRTLRYRATLVAREVEGHWLWVQWQNTPLDAVPTAGQPVAAPVAPVVIEAVTPAP